MPTKPKLSMTAFDDFFDAPKVKKIAQVSEVQVQKQVAPKVILPILSKSRTSKLTTSPVKLSKVVEPEKAAQSETKQPVLKNTQNKSEVVAVDRIRFATLIKPELHKQLKMRCVVENIDIYEAIELALEKYLAL